MNSGTEHDDAEQLRTMPGWVRLTVWIAVALLTLSVIGGMFLY